MSTFKALTGAKSLKDAFDLQASLARTALEKTMAESGKLTDASLKLTEQALAPLTARVTLAMEKFAQARPDRRPMTRITAGRWPFSPGEPKVRRKKARAPRPGLFSCGLTRRT